MKFHPLQDETQHAYRLTFKRDNKTNYFVSVFSNLSGDRMTYFNNEPPKIGLSNKQLKTMISKIKDDPQNEIILEEVKK